MLILAPFYIPLWSGKFAEDKKCACSVKDLSFCDFEQMQFIHSIFKVIWHLWNSEIIIGIYGEIYVNITNADNCDSNKKKQQTISEL